MILLFNCLEALLARIALQFAITDRWPNLGAICISLPMCPCPVSTHVIDQLVEVARHAHSVRADYRAVGIEHRPGDHEHIAADVGISPAGAMCPLA